MDELMDPGGCVVPLETELTEARAEIAVLREALEDAAGWCWQCHGKRETEIIDPAVNQPTGDFEECGQCKPWLDVLAATPSDCLKQIRAEVLEEGMQLVDTLRANVSEQDPIVREVAESTITAACEMLRALKDKP